MRLLFLVVTAILVTSVGCPEVCGNGELKAACDDGCSNGHEPYCDGRCILSRFLSCCQCAVDAGCIPDGDIVACEEAFLLNQVPTLVTGREDCFETVDQCACDCREGSLTRDCDAGPTPVELDCDIR